MTNIQIIEVTDAITNQIVEHVIEEFAPNEFRATPKAIWDEQQKAAELGGTL